jgi:glycosyltransferase involved in cell wall biosynthesis
MIDASLACTTPRVSVVMPCFNERDTVREIVRRVLETPMALELVVVDDASTDGTEAILNELARSEPRMTLVRHRTNRGKGAAIRTGLSRCRGDVIVVQDADLEYDPAELPAVVAPVLRGDVDALYGSRFFAGSGATLGLVHRFANWALTWLTNLAAGLRLTDAHTCYKAFRRETLLAIDIEEDRFGFDTEVTIKVAKVLGARFGEVPIGYRPRSYEEGKKIGLRDALRTLYANAKYGLRRHRRLAGAPATVSDDATAVEMGLTSLSHPV